MASKIKVDAIETTTGSGSIAINNTLSGFTSTGIDDNATSTAITIDSSENVGIGTTTPTNKAHLHASGSSYLQITNGTSGALVTDGAYIGLANADTTLRITNRENSGIRLSPNDTESLFLTNDGRGLSEFTVYCWLNYNGSSNSIRDSHNVSSVSDWGTGDFGIYIASGFGNSNYSAVGMSSDHRIMTCNTSNTAPQGGRFDFEVRDGGGTGVDRDYNFVQLVGSP